MDINVFDSVNISESLTPIIVADRFWVGGAGTWDNSTTTNWSLTSGGGGGASVPTKNTNVIFDSNSGGGVVTMGANVSIYDLDMNGWTGTITGSFAIITYGWKIRLRNGGSSYWGTSTIIQINSSCNVTLDPNGSPFGGRINFNQQPLQGVTFITYLLNDLAGATFLYLYYGEFKTNNYAVGAIFFNSNTTGGIKKLTLGSSIVTLSDPTNSYYSFFGNGVGTFTLDAGTSTIKISGSLYGESRTFNNVESTGNLRIYNTPTFNDLKLAGGYTATCTASGSVYVNSLTSGGTAGNLASLVSSTAGTAFVLRSRINRSYKVFYMSIKDCTLADTTVVWFANKSTDVSGNTNWRFGSDRYWVGGTASWNGTAGSKWALTSGGAGGQAEPTYTDDVYFDTNSGSNTITIDTADASCNDFKTTGFSGTITGSTKFLNVYGDFLLSATTTWGFSNSLFIYSGYYSIINTNGASLTSTGLYISSNGGKITLSSNLVTKQFTLVKGTFDSNDFNLSSWGYYSTSTANVRTLLMKSGTWSIIGDASLTAGYCWNVLSTNLTLDPGTSIIDFVPNYTVSNAPSFYGGGMTYNTLRFSNLTSTPYLIWDSSTFNTIAAVGGLGITIKFTNATTTTITDLSVDSTSLSNPVHLNSSSAGSAFTLTKPSGTITVRDVEIKDSTATGGATFRAYNSINTSGNTGWIFDYEVSVHDDLNVSESVLRASVAFSADSINISENVYIGFSNSRYWVGGSGTWDATAGTKWALTSGGPGGQTVPTSADNVFFDANSGAVTIDGATGSPSCVCKNLNATGFTGTWKVQKLDLYGSLTLNSLMTVTIVPTTTFNLLGSSTNTITTAGQIIPPFNATSGTGTWTLQDPLSSSSGDTTISAETINLNNYNFTLSRLVLSGGTLNAGSSLITITSAFQANYIPSGSSFNYGTSTIKFTGVSSPSFDTNLTGTGTLYNLQSSTSGDARGLRLTSNFTCINNAIIDAGSTLTLTGKTLTVNNLVSNGTGGSHANLIGGTLSKSSGSVTVDYMTITNNTASGGATFYAGLNSIDGGGNTGWVFPIININSALGDTLNISESVTTALFFNINVRDSINISELPSLSNTQLGGINKFDSLNISELIVVSMGLFPVQFVYISESITVSLLPMNVSSVDSINISSPIANVEKQNLVSSYDLFNISENVSIENILNIFASDSINVSELLSCSSVLGNINVYETINISEYNNFSLSININSYDSLRISENFVYAPSIQNISVSDRINISEFVTVEKFWNITVLETMNIAEDTKMESFRFSPSPGGSQPKGTILSITPVASFSTLNPVGSINNSQRYPIAEKGLSM